MKQTIIKTSLYIWYNFLYYFMGMFWVVMFRYRRRANFSVPRKGPVIVIANHTSSLDPFSFGLGTYRQLIPLSRKTLFKNPIFAAFIKTLQAVPIDLDGIGKDGLRLILDRLYNNESVLIFPEGTRTEDGRVAPFRPGVLLLISKIKCPVVPMGIAGAFEAWPYWKPFPMFSPIFMPGVGKGVAVCCGEPISGELIANMPKKEALNKLYAAVFEAQHDAELLCQSS